VGLTVIGDALALKRVHLEEVSFGFGGLRFVFIYIYFLLRLLCFFRAPGRNYFPEGWREVSFAVFLPNFVSCSRRRDITNPLPPSR
jgi:hypothetical protein